MSQIPTLADVLRATMKAYGEGLRVSLPARILEWDPTNPERAVVQPTVQLVQHSSTGERSSYLPEPIAQCPIEWPGGGGYAVTWPLERGDTGRLVFADRSLDEWLTTGNARAEPQHQRRHAYADAVFVPGLRSFGELASRLVDSEAMVVGVPSDKTLKLGSSAASSFIALADLVLTRLNTIESAFNAHTHIYVTPAVPAAPGPTAPPASPVTPTTLADIKSSRVKSE